MNYQFTRPLSLRAIGEYRAVLPNQSLVALTRDKRLVADLLLTYLAHPGTAVYVGYTAGFDNDGSLRADGGAGPPVDPRSRQLFVKVSYVFHM